MRVDLMVPETIEGPGRRGVRMGRTERQELAHDRRGVMRQSRVGRKSSRRIAEKAGKTVSRGRRKPTAGHGRKAAMKGGTRLVLGQTQAKPHRHVASPATVREIAQSLGLTAKDLAAGSSLVDRLNL